MGPRTWRWVAFTMCVGLSACASATVERAEEALAVAERLARPVPALHALIEAPPRAWHRREAWSARGTTLAVAAPLDAGGSWSFGTTANGHRLAMRMLDATGTAQFVGATLVYPDERLNAVVATMSDDALEVLYVVRDPSTSLRWQWSFAQGTSIVDAEGGFLVTGPDGARFRVTAPTAIDADGTRTSVRTTRSTPTTLEFGVDDPVTFPLLVDPIIEVVEWANLGDVGFPARGDHAAVFDESRGVTFVYGGTGSSARSDAWTWDGARWSALPPVSPSPADRTDHAMAYATSSRLTVLFGGVSGGRLTNETWLWDGSGWASATPTASPPARRGHALAYDPLRDRVVLFGGSAGAGSRLRDTWEWDGTTWREVTPARSPAARMDHAMTFDPTTNRVVLHGGADAAFNALGDVWEWDGGAWTERPTTGSTPSWGHSLTVDPTGIGLIAAGGTSVGGDIAETRRLAGSTWTSESRGSLALTRIHHAAVVDGHRSRVLLIGGTHVSSTTTRLGGVLEWSGSEWIPQTLESRPPARSSAALSSDTTRQRLVLFGGLSAASYLDDTWELHHSDWVALTPTRRPPRRAEASLWYDERLGVTFLYGGFDGAAPLSDLWAWDGTDWSPIASPSSTPGARLGHAVSYDSARAQGILFGGSSGAGPDDTTWIWDGAEWTEVTTSSHPSRRRDHAMAYDPSRGVIVLFGGGEIGGSAVYSDTWEWNGTTWFDVTRPGPSARVGHGLTYVPERHAVVLFGGYDAARGFLNETWEWDGSSWLDVSPRGMPSPRSDISFAYDGSARRAIAFGGTVAGGPRSDETWAYSSYRDIGSDCAIDDECGTGVCELGRCVAIRSDAGSLDAATTPDAWNDVGIIDMDAGVIDMDAGVIDTDAGVIDTDVGVSETDGGVTETVDVGTPASPDSGSGGTTPATCGCRVPRARDVGRPSSLVLVLLLTIIRRRGGRRAA